jgi:Phage derived protein Gp49-like (DUF891)
MAPTLLFTGNCIRIYAVTQQVIDAVDAFDKDQRRDFQTCAAVLDRSLEIGRPSSRSERIEGSRTRLFELRVTPPGRHGLHIRLLYVAQARDLLCVRAVLKKRRRITRNDIELADKAVLDGAGDQPRE